MRLRIRCLSWSIVLAGILILPTQAELFVSSFSSHQVYRFDDTTGAFLDRFLPNTDQRLSLPHGLTFGSDGHLYVASAGNDSILRYHGQTGAFRDAFVASGRGGLDYPVAIVFRPDGRLYVTSQLTDQVLRYDAATGAFLDVFVTGIPDLRGPSDLKFGPDGDLYVVGRFSNRVVRCDGVTGAYKSTFATGHLSQPFGLQQLSSGDWVVMSGNGNRGVRFAADGTFRDDFLVTGNLSLPVGISLGPEGALYVANFNAGQIVRFDAATGAFLNVLVAPNPSGLTGPNFFTFRPPEPPVLQITGAADTVSINWPRSAVPWRLEFRSPLNQGEWSTVGWTPVTQQGTNRVTLPTPEAHQFFRLHRP